jgi:hypothetical protein
MLARGLQALYIQVNSKLCFLLKFCSSVVPTLFLVSEITLFLVNETSMFLISVCLKFGRFYVYGLKSRQKDLAQFKSLCFSLSSIQVLFFVKT